MPKSHTNRRIFEKIISVISWLSLFLAILTAIFTIFASMTNEKNGKEIFGYKMLIVASDSMSKSAISASNNDESIFFESGDIIIINTKYDANSLKEGDVISFFSYNPDSYGETLTHKIRSVKRNSLGKVSGFETYGINTGVSDKAFVQVDHLIGVYETKIPYLGRLFSYLKTPAGYYLSILTPLILLIIYFSINVGMFFGRREALKEMSINQANVIVSSEEFNSLYKRVEILETKLKEFTLSEIVEVEQSAIEDIKQLDLEPEIEEKEIEQTPIEDNEKKNLLIISNEKGRTFIEKLTSLEREVQNYFNRIHNELLSFKKVKSRLSNKHVSYRNGRKLLAKMTVCGKTLKLHLALDVNEFNKNVFFQKDLSSVKAYQEVPFTVKVKSNRAEKNAIKLTNALMEKNGLIKNDKYLFVNSIDVLNNAGEQENSQGAILEEIAITQNTGLVIKGKKTPFSKRILKLDKKVQEYFINVHNQLISYKKVNDRVSFKGVSYRLGRKLLAKMTVSGKTLKLHLALDVNEFNKNVFFQKDLSSVKAYQEVPFTVKVKSDRAEKNAIKLIDALMEQNGTVKNSKFIHANIKKALNKKFL